MTHAYSGYDNGRIYAECILYWMLENVTDGQPIDDYEMQMGSGLPDFEFQWGMEWLIQHELVADFPAETLVQ